MEISINQQVFPAEAAPPGAKEAERGDAPVEGPRPKVGKAVMVVHALGAGAVPADLEGAGFELVVATDGEVALSTVRSGRADIAIVDSRFEGDGLAFCEQLWSDHTGFPVVLIGPNDENLVTKALLSGADDYLALPLRPAELVARASAPSYGGHRTGWATELTTNRPSASVTCASTPRATRSLCAPYACTYPSASSSYYVS